jgi:hypothetical protein
MSITQWFIAGSVALIVVAILVWVVGREDDDYSVPDWEAMSEEELP